MILLTAVSNRLHFLTESNVDSWTARWDNTRYDLQNVSNLSESGLTNSFWWTEFFFEGLILFSLVRWDPYFGVGSYWHRGGIFVIISTSQCSTQNWRIGSGNFLSRPFLVVTICTLYIYRACETVYYIYISIFCLYVYLKNLLVLRAKYYDLLEKKIKIFTR